MSENVFMRMIVLFDLPVTTKAKMRAANQFRQFLLKDGYQMLQLSIYTRIIRGRDSMEKHHKRLVEHLPEEGSIRCISITEKQFANMEILVGEKKLQEKKGELEPTFTVLKRFFSKKKALNPYGSRLFSVPIIALRNEKGRYDS
ncbi:CRISPR-associated Cas2 family protein [Actinobacillus ureae]|nr:CRISPR-associated Cas2 family protein [Actinobacillus ureae]SUU46455.1 CRISPR-associated Cas2 family protein [Actinobacillus ureae]